MRILVAHNIDRDYPGGMMRLMRFAHEPLVAAGHEIEYFCADDVSPRWNNSITRRFAFPWLVYRKARQAFKAGRPYDIVNVQEPLSAPVALLKRRVGSRIVVSSDTLQHRTWRSVGLANADHVFCLNEDDRQALKVHFGIVNERMTHICPGAVPIYTEASSNRDYGRCQRLLFAGTWEKNKGIEDFFLAVTDLLHRHPQMELRVLERDIPEAELLPHFPEPLHARIHLLHAKTDAENAAIMADSDILVVPSHFDGAPLTLAEAMASGLPIVTTSAGGLGELIDDGRNGFLAGIRSPQAIVRSIERLIASIDLRRSLGQTARHDTATVYTLNRAAEAAEHAYEQVLRLQPSSATGRRSPRMLFAIHVSRDGDTAVYKNTRDRAAYLEQQGCHCTIISPDDFPWLRHFGSRFTPLLYPLALALWLFRRARCYDVVTFHSYAGWVVLSLASVLGRFRPLRTVVQFHGLEPLYYARLEEEANREHLPLSWRYRFVSGNLMIRLLRHTCRRADMVLCLNSQELRYLVDQGWTESDRVHMLANPAPQSFFISRPHRERARKLLFVGQWLNMKGTRYLVEAFTKLLKEHSDLQLCCAGTLVNSQRVLADFPEQVRERVSVSPRVGKSELIELHRDSDLFVFPTLSEGFSLALIEAMASGLPIVTTPVGASTDILQNDVSVVFCPPRQAETLAASIAELLDNRARREQLGNNAQLVAKKYGPESVWRDYAICLNQLSERDIESGRRMPVARATERD